MSSRSSSGSEGRITAKTIATVLWALVYALCAWPVLAFSLRHYLPVIDNDEIAYFLQIKTFVYHGLNGGYFFVNDQVPASPIHFGVHGPALISIYGVIGRLIGWQNYSPYVSNVAIFLLAASVLVFSLRGRASRQIAIASFVLLHGQVYLFLPSMMQESFHISMAVLLAAMWTRAVDRQSILAWFGLFVLTLVAMLTRYTWGLALPVFVFTFLRQRAVRAGFTGATTIPLACAALLMAAVATYFVLKLWLFWKTPAAVSAQGLSWPSMPRVVRNLREFSGARTIGMFAEYPVYFRSSFLTLLGCFTAMAIGARSAVTREAAVYAGFLLVVPLFAQSAYYAVDGYREFRVLAGFHTLAAVMFLARVEVPWTTLHLRVRGLVIAAGVVLLVLNIQFTLRAAQAAYKLNWNRAEAGAVDQYARLVFAQIATHMQLTPDDTSFCKTAYGSQSVYGNPAVIHLPLGFALSVVSEMEPGRLPPLKGKYALLPNTPSELQDAFVASPDWRQVGCFDLYCFYRSTVNCPDPPSRAGTAGPRTQ